MKLCKSSYEILPQPSGLDGIYKQIEIAGRTCYKSESKGDDPKKFVDRMAKSFHGAMLEAGTVYLVISNSDGDKAWNMKYRYEKDKYSKVNTVINDNDLNNRGVPFTYFYVTTNLRVINEQGWDSDLQYLCEPTDYHEKRHTVRFVLDNKTAQSFERHRSMSFAQESTRYCNYSKGKFGNSVSYILPCWIDDRFLGEHTRMDISDDYMGASLAEKVFISSLIGNEEDYMDLLSQGWKAEEARAVLNNSLACELVMTGFESDWKHFFNLRAKGTTGRPHPQAMELAVPLMEEMGI